MSLHIFNIIGLINLCNTTNCIESIKQFLIQSKINGYVISNVLEIILISIWRKFNFTYCDVVILLYFILILFFFLNVNWLLQVNLATIESNRNECYLTLFILVKSEGLFDQFRRECLADIDTKPAYQNLHYRVESSVGSFLDEQNWNSQMNKNQVREKLRKLITE